MAITIQAQLAKKLPIPGNQFSSQQASITITAEVTDLNQVVSEAHRLYALAEQAVDQQLSNDPAGNSPVPPTTPSTPSPITVIPQGTVASQLQSVPSAPASPAAQYPRRSPSQPYRNGTSRRGPAPITDSQLRYIDRLMKSSHTDLNAVLQEYQVGSLRDLSCKDAAGLIDSLKQGQGVSA